MFLDRKVHVIKMSTLLGRLINEYNRNKDAQQLSSHEERDKLILQFILKLEQTRRGRKFLLKERWEHRSLPAHVHSSITQSSPKVQTSEMHMDR